MYWLDGVLKDKPYRGRQQVKLDDETKVNLRSVAGTRSMSARPRALCPRPPPSHQPRLQGQSPQIGSAGAFIKEAKDFLRDP